MPKIWKLVKETHRNARHRKLKKEEQNKWATRAQEKNWKSCILFNQVYEWWIYGKVQGALKIKLLGIPN